MANHMLPRTFHSEQKQREGWQWPMVTLGSGRGVAMVVHGDQGGDAVGLLPGNLEHP